MKCVERSDDGAESEGFYYVSLKRMSYSQPFFIEGCAMSRYQILNL